jgi:3-hydroxyisobutyrate dehydrogenase-like beta-hydroxyacid dehydrogenase
MTDKERIGFIGVGLMGHGMAANILAKGWPLTIMAHRNRQPVEDLVSRGAREAASPREVALASDVVVLCVTGTPQVREIIEGEDGLAAAGRELVVVDCSTSDPAATVAMAAALASKGVTLIDAPLGRTPADAAQGTLDVMVGGDAAVVARIQPILEAFAGRVTHTGPTGTGHTMKLLNNFLSMGYASLYAEALALGAKAGLSAQTFDAVIRGGRMDCGFYQTFFRYVLDRDENAHRFTIRNGFKDMTYLSSLANATGVANPLGAAIRNTLGLAVGLGHADRYVPMLSDVAAQTTEHA